jgi:predicted transcriptional regulator
MTKTEIEAVLERVRTWPAERQEDAVRVLLEMEAQGTEVDKLSDDERAAIEESMEQARRAEFATDEEVAALFNRYRAPGTATRDL